MNRSTIRRCIRWIGSMIGMCVLLVLSNGLVLGGCASKDDPAPPIATEQQGMRLLRAVVANIATPSPPIAELREHPAIKLALSEYAKSYSDATDGQFAYLRWWSSRYQDIDITPDMRDAATVIPLLLPEADDTTLEQTLVGYPELIFVYDPPLHQPDVDVLAVFLAKDSGLFKAIYNDSSESIGGIQPIVVEQAMSRLLQASRDSEGSSLPIGLQHAGLLVDGDQAMRIEDAWIALTLDQLRDEQKAALDAANLQARVLGQPFSEAGRWSIQTLLLSIPLKDAVRHHPAIKATITQSIKVMLRGFDNREAARNDLLDWSDILSHIYPIEAPDDDPMFRQSLNELYLAAQPEVRPDQPMSR